MDARRILTTVFSTVFIGLNINATDIIVKPEAYAIEKALQQAREERRINNAKDVCIHLSEGTYFLNQPIIVRPEDNGTRIVADGKAVISGGVKIVNWKKEGKYYVADVPEFNGRPLEFRQLWVNGKKAVRARDVADFNNMFRIRSLDKAKETIYVPAAAVRKIVNAKHAEMVIHEMWCIANLRIKGVKIAGDSAAVTFHQPESHIHFMHPWPSPMVTSNGRNSAFYLTNAKELLDTPGILWPKFDDEAVGLRLAYIGSINDEILNVTDIAVELIKFLQANYCQTLIQRYNIESTGDPVQVIAQIAEKRQCIKKGGELDYDKASALLMDDFRSGKLGRITLETP